MSCEKNQKFLLVEYLDGSRERDIMPHDIIKLRRYPDVWGVVHGKTFHPVMILGTSETIDELESISTLKDVETPKKLFSIDHNVVETMKEEKIEEGQIHQYPFMVQGSDKVELVPGSNVWIHEEDLRDIRGAMKVGEVRGIRNCARTLLLRKLIGVENMELTDLLNKDQHKSSLGIVYSAIRRFMLENEPELPKSDFIKPENGAIISARKKVYHAIKYKTIFLARSERQTGGYNKKEREKTAVTLTTYTFPYMKRSKDKVRLVPQIDVWMSRNYMNLINEIYEKADEVDDRKIIFVLLLGLMGFENLKYTSIDDKKCIRLPEKVYSAISAFVKKRNPDNKICEDRMEEIIKVLFEYASDVVSNRIQFEISSIYGEKAASTGLSNDSSSEDLQKEFKNVSSELPTVMLRTDTTNCITTFAKISSNIVVTDSGTNSIMTPIIHNRKRTFDVTPNFFENTIKRQRMCIGDSSPQNEMWWPLFPEPDSITVPTFYYNSHDLLFPGLNPGFFNYNFDYNYCYGFNYPP